MNIRNVRSAIPIVQDASAIFALLVIGGLIRVHFITRTMRYDEAWTFLHYARHPLSDAISSYASTNNHIFHTMLVHLAYGKLGNHPWVLRLPALVAGLALIPASYWLGARAGSRIVGFMTAGLVTLSPLLIEYSVNARGYTLMTFFATASFAIAFRLMQEPSLLQWFLLALCSILGFFTVPVMAYPFATLIFWMTACIATGGARKVKLLNLVLLCVVVGLGTLLLYTPMLRAGGWNRIMSNTTLAHRPPKELVATLPSALAGYRDIFRTAIPLLLQLLLALGLGTVLLWPPRRLHNLRLLLLAGVSAPFLLVFAVRNWPFPRILIYLLPIYSAAACAGLLVATEAILSRWRRRVPARIVSVVAVLVLFGVAASGLPTDRDGYFWSDLPNGDRIAAYIAANIRPGDAILAPMITDAPLEYYLDYYQVPFHHVIADPDWIFNAYADRKRGLPNRDCWTRLIVVEVRGPNQERLDQLLRFMASVGPTSTKTLWEGELVRVYGVSKLPERMAGVIQGKDWVLNGGFEAFNFCWWNQGTAAVEENYVHRGARSLQIGPRSGGTYQQIPLRRSSRYSFSAWGRLTRNTDSGWVGVSISRLNGPEIKQQCEIRSTYWQECALTFVTPSDLDQATVFAWKDNGESEFEVDDFQVQAASPARAQLPYGSLVGTVTDQSGASLRGHRSKPSTRPPVM